MDCKDCGEVLVVMVWQWWLYGLRWCSSGSGDVVAIVDLR